MAYCTVDEVKTISVIDPLLYDETKNPVGYTDDNITDKCEAISEYKIDTQLSSIYEETPIVPTPDVLKRVCSFYVVYELLQQAYGKSEDNYIYFKQEADDLMEKILDGSIDLSTDGNEGAYSAGTISFGDNSTRIFQRPTRS